MTDVAKQEMMVKYASLLPEKPTFNLIEQPELQAVKLRCTLKGCRNQAVQAAVYLPKNQEHRLCENHLELVLKEESKLWKVLSE